MLIKFPFMCKYFLEDKSSANVPTTNDIKWHQQQRSKGIVFEYNSL